MKRLEYYGVKKRNGKKAIYFEKNCARDLFLNEIFVELLGNCITTR